MFLEDEIFNKKNIRFCFKGLDTYADVYINERRKSSGSKQYVPAVAC